MITLGAADLRYLLEQVNIGNDYSKLNSPLDPVGVREVSGQNNNLVGGFTYNADGTVTWTSGSNLHGDWGQADTDFLRMFATDHPTNGSQYGFTFDPVTMQVMDGGGTPIVDASGEPLIVPASFMTQFTQAATPAPGTSPRTITQLISSSDVDPTSATYNPAAAAAMGNLGGQPVDVSNTVVGSALTAEIPNPGILGGVPYNEWFVAFGQFFDHGLDFITKGGGYVLIPLSPSDPLYDPAATGPTANTMMLSRGALSNPASDFDVDASGNAVLKSGVTPQFNNSTGLLIDQSQTYGSHASINVLLRQYDESGTITGKLITNAEDMDPATADPASFTKALHDLATWADMKVNAARLGIGLTDRDVLDAPMIKADAVGHYTFTAQQTVLYSSDKSIADMGSAYSAENDPFVRWTQADADAHRCAQSQVGYARTCNQAILSDMGNGASPMSPMGQFLPPKPADTTGLVEGIDYYDPAKLAAHYVSGDHRANENVGLTAVHHIFHEEHNIEADAVMLAALKEAVGSGNLTNLNASTGGWLASDITQADLDGMVADHTDNGLVDYQAIADALTWNGEKIYQAARIITESEYNHIAIDQYVGGLVVLPEFVSYSSDVNLDVSLEFSQAVFRLGHSQLTETLRIALPNESGKPGDPGFVPGEYTEVGLFDAFLNPSLYNTSGAAAITLGLLNQQGNEIDEFVTAAVQQSLVGAPLDLAALNIARGRDVGLPTLNELRQQIFDGLVQNTNNASNPGIAPYTSWEDFGGHLRNPESLVNFIAAYGREDSIFHLQTMRDDYESGRDAAGLLPGQAGYSAPAVTLQDLRANAQIILDAAADSADPLHEAAMMFMRGQGSPTYDPVTHTWNQNDTGGGDQGFWDIDLWIGGLAEQPLFDGPLGTTFTFVMEDFGQRMQDGDRFYYLYRMPVGHHLGDQIIGEQFADLIMRTTGLEHIGDAFGYQSATYYLDGYKNHADASGGYIDNNYDGTIGVDDKYDVNDYFNSIYEHLPISVKAFVVANSSFEAASDAGIVADPKGDYSIGAPAGWTLSGTGGVYAPATQGANAVIGEAGHVGEHVAWLTPGAVLTQDLGQAIAEGSTYTFTLNLGNRTDQGVADGSTFGAVVQLLDATGAVVVERAVTGADVSDGHWMPISFSNVAGAGALGTLRIRIQNSGSEQVLIDNVHVTVSEPGGSANDGHTVIAGLEGDDYLIAGLGDDYVYGDAGNDVIEGAQGNDHLYGGAGDDWITDYENDDFIHGGDGDDYISAGPGVLDTSHGGNGNDEVHGGDGVDEVYGDDGDDRLYGDGDTDLIMGGEGNDFMDGGDSVDEMFGGNGNDWMRGGVGDDNINGGSGNDLMEGGLGPTANDGDRLNGDTAPGALPVIEFNGDGTEGDMDIASYENVTFKIIASLQDANANGTSSNLLDTYALVEGLVGSAQGDELTGADANGTAGNGVNNYLIGGGGNDTLTGLGDDAGANGSGSIDFIFGDSIIVDNDLYWIGDDRHIASGHGDITGYLTNWYGTGETRVVFQDGTLGHILGDKGAEGTSDTAVYRGNYSVNAAQSDYKIEYITLNGQEAVKITDLRGPDAVDAAGNPIATDGVDILVGVEFAKFANGTVSLVVTPPELDLHASDDGFVLDNFSPSSDYAGNDGSVNWSGGWTEIGDNAGLGGDITIASNALNFNTGVASGDSASRAVDLSGATSATLSFNWSENGADPGETILVKAFNGASWEAIGTLVATNGNASGDVSVALTSSQIGAHTAIRFEYAEGASGILESSENFYIDNVRIDFTKPVDDAGDVNYSASFTENGPATAIAINPSITDDGTTIASAQIILTNAKPGDVLHENGVGGDGIAGSLSNAGGTLTLTLTGVASLAAYQAAIARVTFENTSDAPDTEARVIKVTVNDGQVDSNVATATIDVTPVNDAPSVGDDYVVSNSVTAIVPEWALLANDSDADGPNPLALTGLTSGLSGLASASRSANPGAVTIQDSGTAGGSFDYTATDGLANGTGSVSFTRQTGTTISGNDGFLGLAPRNEILIGGSASETLDGNRGDDILLAGGGDDTIVWNAATFFGADVLDGRDFVDGGTNTATGDRFVVTGNSTSETFAIYSNTDHWDGDPASVSSAAHAGFTGLNASTEIVVTRNGSVIAELDNVEEITINTLDTTANNGNGGPDAGTSAGDTIQVVGNFSGTSLNYSTITINGDDGDDTLDMSKLTSDHRIVFHGGGGANQVIGTLRPQDVFDGSSGSGGPVLPPAQGDQGSDDDGEEDDRTGSGDQDHTPATGGNDAGSGGPDPRPSPGDDDAAGHDQSDHAGSGGGDGRTGGPSNEVVDGGHRDRGVFSGEASEYHFGLRGGKVVVSDRVAGRDGIDTLSGGEKVRFDDDSFVLRAGDNHGKHVWGSNFKSDVLLGFGGDDVLDGGRKADVLVGGAGKDRFVFDDWDTGVGEGRRDTILDFNHGQDRLDLKAIDANHARHGDQRFYFKGTHDFTGAQQVRYEHVDTNGDGVADSTLVQGNVNVDLGADFEIMLKGYLGPLHAHDILF